MFINDIIDTTKDIHDGVTTSERTIRGVHVTSPITIALYQDLLTSYLLASVIDDITRHIHELQLGILFGDDIILIDN